MDEGKTKTVVVGIQQIVETTLLFGGKVVNEVMMGQRGSSPTVREGVEAVVRTPSFTVGLLPHDSLHPLPDLLGTKRADPVQAKREDDSIFISQAHVEGEVLGRDHAALPGVADGRS